MKLLLDTNSLLWWLGGEGLKESALVEIASPANHVVVSVASVWEIAIKTAKGKLVIDGDLLESISESRFEVRDIEVESAMAVRDLPHFHGDPFDRMIIAQAQLGGYTIVTSDSMFNKYDVEILPA